MTAGASEPEVPVTDRVRDQPVEREMHRSYIDYAMSVIIGRALPEGRDGLKPVHRRILWSMWETGATHDRAYRKSARTVGDVLGKFHPHGELAVYDALVRMAQPFSLRYPLIDGQGNFGSIDGDSPAAMRYTEARLSPLAEEMLLDIEKETVTWGDNFDGSLKEPLVLPSKLPNLLVNGSAGIAVGMATNMPPHNLGEIVDALLLLLKKSDATLDEIMRIVPVPDLPTGGLMAATGVGRPTRPGAGRFGFGVPPRSGSAMAGTRSSSPRSRTRSTRRAFSSSSRTSSRTNASTASPTCGTNRIRMGRALSSSSVSMPPPRSCSIASTSTRPSRPRSA